MTRSEAPPLGALRVPGRLAALDDAAWRGLPRTPEGVVDLTGGTVRWPSAWFDGELEALDFDPLCHLAHYLPQLRHPRAPLRRVVRGLVARWAPAGAALGVEAGCSVGSDVRALAGCCRRVIAFDANPVPVRAAATLFGGGSLRVPERVEGHRFRFAAGPLRVRPLVGVTWLLGNALDPPIAPGAADLVVAVNLLDSVSEPLNLLGHLDAMLRPGGVLVLTSPFHWQDHLTPVAAQLAGGGHPEYDNGSADLLRDLLEARAGHLPGARYEVLEAADVPWTVRDHPRCAYQYRVHALAARKRDR